MVRGVAGANSVAEDRGSRRECSLLGCVALVWALLFAPRTWSSDNYGKMCGAQKCGSFHVADHRQPGMGLRDRSRAVYYHLQVAGAFRTPSQSLGRTMLFRQVKISCYATKGNERRQGGGGLKRPGKDREPGCCPGQGFLSERGWRSGREPPEKERWFNYASGERMGSSWAANGNV